MSLHLSDRTGRKLDSALFWKELGAGTHLQVKLWGKITALLVHLQLRTTAGLCQATGTTYHVLKLKYRSRREGGCRVQPMIHCLWRCCLQWADHAAHAGTEIMAHRCLSTSGHTMQQPQLYYNKVEFRKRVPRSDIVAENQPLYQLTGHGHFERCKRRVTWHFKESEGL